MNARPCQLELLIALIKFVRLFKNDGDVDFFWVVLQHFHVGGEVSVHERLPHAQQHGQEDVNWKGRDTAVHFAMMVVGWVWPLRLKIVIIHA